MIRVPSVHLTNRQSSEEKHSMAKVNVMKDDSDEEILYQPASLRPFKITEKAAPISIPYHGNSARRKEPTVSNA